MDQKSITIENYENPGIRGWGLQVTDHSGVHGDTIIGPGILEMGTTTIEPAENGLMTLTVDVEGGEPVLYQLSEADVAAVIEYCFIPPEEGELLEQLKNLSDTAPEASAQIDHGADQPNYGEPVGHMADGTPLYAKKHEEGAEHTGPFKPGVDTSNLTAGQPEEAQTSPQESQIVQEVEGGIVDQFGVFHSDEDMQYASDVFQNIMDEHEQEQTAPQNSEFSGNDVSVDAGHHGIKGLGVPVTVYENGEPQQQFLGGGYSMAGTISVDQVEGTDRVRLTVENDDGVTHFEMSPEDALKAVEYRVGEENMKPLQQEIEGFANGYGEPVGTTTDNDAFYSKRVGINFNGTVDSSSYDAIHGTGQEQDEPAQDSRIELSEAGTEAFKQDMAGRVPDENGFVPKKAIIDGLQVNEASTPDISEQQIQALAEMQEMLHENYEVPSTTDNQIAEMNAAIQTADPAALGEIESIMEESRLAVQEAMANPAANLTQNGPIGQDINGEDVYLRGEAAEPETKTYHVVTDLPETEPVNVREGESNLTGNWAGVQEVNATMTVEEGDTIWAMTKEHFGLSDPSEIALKVGQVLELNGLDMDTARGLQPGQEIRMEAPQAGQPENPNLVARADMNMGGMG